MTVEGVLCFLFQGARTLLLRKREGLFGGCKWNAPGGKVLVGETPMGAAIREKLEETGFRPIGPSYAGLLNFYAWSRRLVPEWRVHVFYADKFEGEVREGGEGALRWFHVEELPYDQMWADDVHWIPLVVKREDFTGYFYFSGDFENLLDYRLSSREAIRNSQVEVK